MLSDFFESGGVPKTHCSITATAGEMVAIGGKGKGGDGSKMAAQSAGLLERREVPEPDRVVLATAGERAAIR